MANAVCTESRGARVHAATQPSNKSAGWGHTAAAGGQCEQRFCPTGNILQPEDAMVVSELSCSYHQHVASDAQLAPDQQLLSQASGKHGCFVSDGQCIQHLQPSTPDACAVLLHDASQAETQTPGSAPSGTAKSEPFQLLAANASPSNASCKLAAAAGHVLHIFNLGSQPYQQGFNADAAPTLSQQLQEATGARWRALAWHPVQHDILAAASQVHVAGDCKRDAAASQLGCSPAAAFYNLT